jgi:hypothetical protein
MRMEQLAGLKQPIPAKLAQSNRASIDLKTGFNSAARRFVTVITQLHRRSWLGQHVFLSTPIGVGWFES